MCKESENLLQEKDEKSGEKSTISDLQEEIDKAIKSKLSETDLLQENPLKVEELQVKNGEKTSLSKLQEEIDKLLAPLTPPLASLTPTRPIDRATRSQSETEEIPDITENEEDEEEEKSSVSSTVSSSPFELCEVTETAIVEIAPENIKTVEIVKNSTLETAAFVESVPKPVESVISQSSNSGSLKFKIGKAIKDDDEEAIQVITTEIMEAPDSTLLQEGSSSAHDMSKSKSGSREGSPLSAMEAQALLRIVDEQDKLDREKKLTTSSSSSRNQSQDLLETNVDDYMLASSRIMLRKQLRQQAIGKLLAI